MDKARVRPVTGIQQAFFLREIPVGDSGEFQQRVNQPVGLVRLMAVRLRFGGSFGTRLAVFGGEPQQKWDLIARVDVRITGDPVGHSRIKCFFIGAPLGAIIRKGGLGMPVVLSVLIFILYYIIDSGATRVAKSGEMNIILGTWMSTLVLAPLGGFLTYKSNKDSVVFNIDVYIAFFRKLLGIRQSRHIFKKEVIIHTPDYADIVNRLEAISGQCQDYANKHKLLGPPNYFQIFTNNEHDDAIREISLQIENLIEELSNSKDNILLNMLNKYPYLSVKAHKSLFDNRWLNLIFGIIVPAGLLVWLNIWRYRERLDKDLKVILKTNEELENHIRTNLL